jgi:hypothetical protein
MPISEFFSSGNFAFIPQKSFEGVVLDFPCVTWQTFAKKPLAQRDVPV